MTETVLCVDIGTTSLKAALVTAEGGVVSFCSVPVKASQSKYAACSWYGTFLSAVRKLASDIKGEVMLKGIAVSGNGPTVVSDCGYTVFWNDDLSDVKLPSAADLDSDAAGSLFLPRLFALKGRNPRLYKKAKYIFSGPEYFIYILTGHVVTILPEERFMSAYWNKKTCKTFGIDADKLPPFVGVGACCGFADKRTLADILVEGTRGCGIKSNDILVVPQECPVFAGGPDFVSALIGTGTLQAGRLCDRCGSSEGLNFCTERPVTGEGLRTLPSVIPDLWNVSYLIPESGRLSGAERIEAVEKGITCLKNASGRAGISFPSEMAVTGGQTNDELLLKEKSERLGMKLLCPCENHFVHSELLGDACAAWYGLGVYESLQLASEKIVRMKVYENL